MYSDRNNARWLGWALAAVVVVAFCSAVIGGTHLVVWLLRLFWERA